MLTKKMLTKKILIYLAVLLTAAVLLLPFPQRIDRTYSGVLYPTNAPDSAEACSVQLNGTCYRFLLREDEYVGKFIISALPYTAEEYGVTAGGESNQLYFLAHPTDDGYRTTGQFLTPDGFGSMYIHLNDVNGQECRLVVPAEDAAEAQAYIANIEAAREFPLP